RFGLQPVAQLANLSERLSALLILNLAVKGIDEYLSQRPQARSKLRRPFPRCLAVGGDQMRNHTAHKNRDSDQCLDLHIPMILTIKDSIRWEILERFRPERVPLDRDPIGEPRKVRRQISADGKWQGYLVTKACVSQMDLGLVLGDLH